MFEENYNHTFVCLLFIGTSTKKFIEKNERGHWSSTQVVRWDHSLFFFYYYKIFYYSLFFFFF